MRGSGYVLGAEPLSATSGGVGIGPDFIAGMSPAAWYRYGLGITVATGVSQWSDQSGNSRHATQGTGAAQPTLQADNSIVWDGTDDVLSTSAFTLNQPATVYLLGQQVTWTGNDVIFDGAGGVSFMQQFNASPSIRLFAGSGVADNTNWTVGAYAAVASVFNGASSLIQVNNTAPTTGNAGAGNFGGFFLGANSVSSVFANVQLKEVILFAGAHDAPTRARVILYLGQVGQIPV